MSQLPEHVLIDRATQGLRDLGLWRAADQSGEVLDEQEKRHARERMTEQCERLIGVRDVTRVDERDAVRTAKQYVVGRQRLLGDGLRCGAAAPFPLAGCAPALRGGEELQSHEVVALERRRSEI